jgi:hypothetical protein
LDGREAEEDQGEEEEDCECGEISTINSSDTTSIHFLFRCRCLRLDAPLQRNKRKVITGRKEGIARVSLVSLNANSSFHYLPARLTYY